MKVQTAFRLEKELIDALKVEAKKNSRSLNNYVELALHKIIEKTPNDETVAAIEDAMSNNNLVTDVRSFLNSID